jgi:hypothetical protein
MIANVHVAVVHDNEGPGVQLTLERRMLYNATSSSTHVQICWTMEGAEKVAHHILQAVKQARLQKAKDGI